ncbi:MAG: hypothetical protein K2N03_05730 [Muribaculaceae bacterium]|nr:hypothetical protein [Muribaculaceae bacterium]
MFHSGQAKPIGGFFEKIPHYITDTGIAGSEFPKTGASTAECAVLNSEYRFEWNPKHFYFNSAINALNFFFTHDFNNFKRIFIPAYTCPNLHDSVLSWAIKNDSEWKFYNIDHNFLPIIKNPLHKGDVIILTNYFGILDNRLHHWYLKNRVMLKDALTIVDNSQSLFSSISPFDLGFYSFRKFVGVSNGAALISDSNPGDDFIRNYSLLQEDLSPAIPFHSRLRAEGNLKDGFAEFKRYEAALEEEKHKKASSFVLSEMERIDFRREREVRRNNFMTLHDALGERNILELPSTDEFEAPLIYPFLFKHGKGMDFHKRLIDSGIFVARYWSKLIKDRDSDMQHSQRIILNKFEQNLANDLLPLPIDGRYGSQEMKYIISKINLWSNNS